DEPAGGFVQGQPAETVTEEREWTIQEFLHPRDQLIDELADVGDRSFLDAAQPPRGFDRHHFDGFVEGIRPGAIDRRSAAGERKAEQAEPRAAPGLGHDQPAPRRWLRLRVVRAPLRLMSPLG